MAEDKFARRTLLAEIIQTLREENGFPDMAHFEHKLTGKIVLTDDLDRVAALRADEGWREVRADTGS